jgi:hypothetical protein
MARPLAWVLAAIAAVPMFGLIDLVTLFGWVDPAYEWEVPLEVSWGTLFTLLIAGSYVWIAVVPDRAMPAVIQLAIGAAGLVIASVVGLDGRPLWIAVPVAGSAVLFAWLTSATRNRGGGSWTADWSFALLAAGGMFIWLPYASHALAASRAHAEGDITNGIQHWPVQGAAGLAFAGCAVVMAVWPPSVPLFRLTVSMSSTLIGAAMLAHPDRAGAMDHPLWGIAMVIWGTAVALARPSSQGRCRSVRPL